MHYENFRDHDYLAAFHFEGGDRTLTIDRVVQGVIEKDKAKPERVALVYFREVELPLVLNSTNGKMIHMMYGTPDVAQWKGKRITLTRSLTTNLSGDPVMGIRVHPQRPEEATFEESPVQKAARLQAELDALMKSQKPPVEEPVRPALPVAPPSSPATTANGAEAQHAAG